MALKCALASIRAGEITSAEGLEFVAETRSFVSSHLRHSNDTIRTLASDALRRINHELIQSITDLSTKVSDRFDLNLDLLKSLARDNQAEGKKAAQTALRWFVERKMVDPAEVNDLMTDNLTQSRINEIIDLPLPPPYSFEGVRAVIALRKELKALSESEAAYRAENVRAKQAQLDGYISGARGTAKLPEEAFIEKTLSVEVKTDGGTVWHQYELVGYLGKDGGMGRVFTSRRLGDEVAGRLFVIKILKLDQLEDMEALFLKEGARITELEHKGIVKGYGTGHVLVTEGKPPQPFMVMEKHQMSLQQALDDNLLNPEQKLFVLREVIDALRYTWETRHFLHRDIKPDNILLDIDTDGQIVAVKVADFGLSKSLDEIDKDGLTKTARVMGTASFLAPEVAEITSAKREGGAREAKLRASAERTDIYQLGNLAYRLAFNSAPPQRDFSGDTNLWWKFAYAKGADLAQYTLVKPADATHVTSAMWDFILRTMEIDPARRLQTWAAVAEAASKIDLPKPEEEEPTEVTPPPQPTFASEDEALKALRVMRAHLWGEASPDRETLGHYNADLLAMLAGLPQSRDVADWAAPALAQINLLLGGE